MKQDKRECGSCTKCCEGWLSGQAYDHKFWIGRPCFFMKKGGCSIYKDRPYSPCKTYNCEWLINEDIPHWMKPEDINAIVTKKTLRGIEYYDITEAGEKLRVEVLSWFVIHALNNSLNIRYGIAGGHNRIGSLEFFQLDNEELKQNQ